MNAVTDVVYFEENIIYKTKRIHGDKEICCVNLDGAYWETELKNFVYLLISFIGVFGLDV